MKPTILHINRVIMLSLIAFTSCESFIDIPPPQTQIITPTVYTDDNAATSAILGIYSSMTENISGIATGGTTRYGGWSSDELSIQSDYNAYKEIYSNEINPTNDVINSLWTESYKYIYYANSALEGIEASNSLTPETKKQLEGEAKFIRAFIYFHLVNFWGDVPLVTNTDYRTNSKITRTSKETIYQQITEDLISARELLPEDYITTERVRANKWVASALLARVYLFNKQWKNAENIASNIIGYSQLFHLEKGLDSVFLAESSEAIWQLKPVQPFINANDAQTFIMQEGLTDVALNKTLYHDFEPNDNRKSRWIGIFINPEDSQTYYYAHKYKALYTEGTTEYNMIFRLAEQYLIRAEARAQQGDISGAQDDINTIRNRAGLPNTDATELDSILATVEHERRIELFTEGHRWFDLNRTNKINDILASIKPNWQTTDMLYPIPRIQILNDPNMKNQQNPGY